MCWTRYTPEICIIGIEIPPYTLVNAILEKKIIKLEQFAGAVLQKMLADLEVPQKTQV